MNKFRHTFWFYAESTFSKVGLIVLSLTFLATVGILFAINFFGGAYSEIAIVQNSDMFVVEREIIESLPERNFHFVTESEANQMFDDGEVSDIFIIHGEERPELTVYTSEISADVEVGMLLQQQLTELHLMQTIINYEIPIEIAVELTTPIAITVNAADLDDFLIVTLLNNLIPTLIMLPVMLMGSLVANSVTSEKASRVMEIMLGKVHPTITMNAKVMARFVSMLMFISMIVLGGIVAQLTGIINLSEAMAFFGDLISLEVMILTIVVILVAFFVFIYQFAAAGAIATSVESLNKIITPLTLFPLVGIMLPMFVAIDSLVMDIMVYVPLVSPFVIVQRFILGYSGILEVIISIALMIAFALGTLIISARVYKNGIAHNAEKLTMKDVKMLLQK